MAKVSDKQTHSVKMLLMGESGVGKTGSLFSLLEAGYHIRLLDLDNGIDYLRLLCQSKNPKLLERLDVVSIKRDKYIPSAGARGQAIMTVKGAPKAFPKVTDTLNKWDDGSIPEQWPANTVLVIDSLTMLGDMALTWATALSADSKDGRQWYGSAGNGLLNILMMLTDETFPPNVIVITHTQLREIENAGLRGLPTSVGVALSEKLPRLFNTVVLAHTVKGKRLLRTVSNNLFELKNPAPFQLEADLPIETGLLSIFNSIGAKP